MKVIKVRNVHEALPNGLQQLMEEGVERDSRNGPVLVFDTPVTSVYTRPCERVLFWPARDANPFFHFFESLWMLKGANDVEFIAQFVKRMATFSDDDETFHGAYGYRWRKRFDIDQLRIVIDRLRDNPDDRRCVVQIWDSRIDLGKEGKDFPCNTQIFFSRNKAGALDMTVTNRSNDLIWGCYGANAVHFSFLQEYIAACIGCPVGTYSQMSNNLHGYKETLLKVESLMDEAVYAMSIKNPYVTKDVSPYPLVSVETKLWDTDLATFFKRKERGEYADPFFTEVTVPLWNAHKAYKDKTLQGRMTVARTYVEQCQATDWKKACSEWLDRRQVAEAAKSDHSSVDSVSP
jgi:hypothetical protein